MYNFIKYLIVLIILSIVTNNAFSDYLFCDHVVKNNESLIRILKIYKLYPIYGENGSLNETLNLNPNLRKLRENGNKIFPNELIRLNNYKFDYNEKQNYIKYKVLKGDNLYIILKKFKKFPFLGKNGAINDVLLLNPIIKKRSSKGNIIYPNEIILIKSNINKISYCDMNQNVSIITENNSDNNLDKNPNNNSVKNPNNNSVKNPDNKKYFNIYAELINSYERIDANDVNNQSNALLISYPSLGFIIGSEQFWNKDNYTGFYLKYQKMKFKQFHDNSLENENVNIGGYEENYNNIFWDDYIFSLNFQNRKFVYLMSPSINKVNIDSNSLFGIGFGVSYKILNNNLSELKTNLGLIHYLSSSNSSYSIYPWNLYRFGLNYIFKFEKYSLFSGINYEFGEQKTSIVVQNYKLLEGIIGFSIEVGT